MTNLLTEFRDCESGAVTVDWVVLTAAIVGLGMIALVPIAYSTDNIADGTAAFISTVPVGYGN